ncbi:hypothetical protein F5B19DRAFT_318799 [Rostrohypoxylon terebratum]|nr:hypothetical protein F5B19DRAFT_318799 [Rostrohypoxylon terebratum]
MASALAGFAANLSHRRLRQPLLLFLSILTQSIGAQEPTPSIVSVFLPSYGPRDWAALRGSIISSNDVETTYTIFCAADESHSCNIGGGTLLPFTFAEGPLTYHYEQTINSTISVTQACVLSNTTAATCSGSTSLGAITLGPLSGPSSTSVAPFTLAGPSLHWAALTLAAPPQTSTAGSLTLTYYSTGAAGPTDTSSSGTVHSASATTATTNDPTAQIESESTSGGQKTIRTPFGAISMLSMAVLGTIVILP